MMYLHLPKNFLDRFWRSTSLYQSLEQHSERTFANIVFLRPRVCLAVRRKAPSALKSFGNPIGIHSGAHSGTIDAQNALKIVSRNRKSKPLKRFLGRLRLIGTIFHKKTSFIRISTFGVALEKRGFLCGIVLMSDLIVRNNMKTVI